MKKAGILNPLLISEISKLGHKDIFVISDAGLPIPEDVKRIDFAIAPNLPRFLEMLEVILQEIIVEKVVFAREILERNKETYKKALELLGRYQKHLDFKQDVILVFHEEFKREYVAKAKFVVRTGEFTPYSNIALICGVPF